MSFSNLNIGQNNDYSIPLGVAYVNYNIDGHGMMISTERIIKEKYVIEAALTAYKHDFNDQSISFNAFFSRRFNYQSGFSPQIGIGAGIVNTWIDNEHSQGQIVDEESGGDLALSTAIKVTPFGWDFRTKEDFPVRVFLDCVLFARYPELKSIDSNVLFQLGATYYFRYTSKKNEFEI